MNWLQKATPDLQHSPHTTGKGDDWITSLAQKAMPLPVDIPKKERWNAGVDRIDDIMSPETADQLREQYPEIEYGGAGKKGIAFQTGPGEMMKITRDVTEANAAQYVFENPMDWVVEVLEEPQMIQDSPPMWSIRTEMVQPIQDHKMSLFISVLVNYYDQNMFPDNKEAIQAMIHREGLDNLEEAMKVYAHVKYILDRNQQTLWLTDLHGQNMGWGNDGNLKVFDLGPGLT